MRAPRRATVQQVLLLLICCTIASATANTINPNTNKDKDKGRAELARLVAHAPPLTRAADAAAVPRSDRASVEYGGADPDWRRMRGLPEFPLTYSTEAQNLRKRQRELWPDGYAALCACVRDQRRDLRYWIEYHAWLGVDKFYVFDHNSTRPLASGLSDYLATGLVELQAFKGRPRRLPSFLDTNQWRAYQACIEQHRGRHRWIGFLDVDEFIVFDTTRRVFGGVGGLGDGLGGGGDGDGGGDGGDAPGRAAATAALLALPPSSSSSQQQQHQHHHNGHASEGLWPLYLHQHEHFGDKLKSVGGLALNWVLYASGGLASRPRGGRGPLRSFTACAPRDHRESRHFKVAAAHTGHVLAMGGTPHAVVLKPGAPEVVDAAGRAVTGPLTEEKEDKNTKRPTMLPVWSPVALHHYATKSRAEFLAKEARGTGASNRKDAGYWAYAEALANSTCDWARGVGEAFEGGVGGLGGGGGRGGGGEVVERPAWYAAWESVMEAAGCGGGEDGSTVAATRRARATTTTTATTQHQQHNVAPLPGTPQYYADRANGVVPRMPDDWLDARRVRQCFLPGEAADRLDEQEERRLQAAEAALEEAAAALLAAGAGVGVGDAPKT